MESVVHEKLKSLCCSYGWSYGVLWKFDHQNPMFLTLAEAYEDGINCLSLIDDMLLQVHILGQGIVGEAAFTGKDQWIHSEVLDESLMGSGTSVSYQDNEVGTDLRCQFVSGIKTVVAIPLEPHGVAQFGSTKKMVESLSFPDQTKKLWLENISFGQGKSSMLSPYEAYGSDNWFDLLFLNEISTCKDQVVRPSGTSNKLTEEICDSLNISHSPASVSKMPHVTNDRLSVDPDVVLSEMASLDQLFPSETTHGSPFVFPPFQQDSHTASTFSIQELFDVENYTPFNSRLLLGGLPPDVMNSDVPDISASANLPSPHTNQWPVAQLNSTRHVDVSSKDDFSLLSCVSISSSLNQVRTETPDNNLVHLLEGNFTDSFNHVAPIKQSNPITGLAKDIEGRKEPTTVVQTCPPLVSSCVSGISELDAISASRPRKCLFSELGLVQLLSEAVHNSAYADRSCYDDLYSTSKKRKMECASASSSQIHSEVFSCLSDKISSFQSNHQKATKPENLGFGSDFMLKRQAGLWIDDSYSINAGSTSANTNTSLAKRTQESTKPIKKRARPGESTRPRPKDRQQFQDRLVELRKMIPNAGKSSIDALLDSTTKHMIFLQNVTKYAEKLKRIADQKEKGSISKSNANGVTWAFEMCDQGMMCPIKVEDVGSSGQMLIDMLCENGGTFLEIADTIRGFGLCILKGSMEDRNDKTWAHFIVEAEASSTITRVDVFWSLAQHLQQSSSTTGTNSINQQHIKVSERTSVAQPEYRHQLNLPQPILTDARR